MIRPARVNPVLAHDSETRCPLDSNWRFRLDPDEVGLAQHWYRCPDMIAEPIAVPGCWQGQGFGNESKDMVWDFRLEARTFRATYTGTGWYAMTVRPPSDWCGERLWLNFGGAHPSAEVWVNGHRIGGNDLPFVPFSFEVTDLVQPGRDADVVVRVYEANRELGFAYSWQGNWSGLYRPVELRGTGTATLARLWTHADAKTGELTVRATIEGTAHAPLRLRLALGPEPGSVVVADEFPVAPGENEVRLRVQGPHLWSPDCPNLYRLEVALVARERVQDAMVERVGFVQLATADKRFLINGDPYYMRGTGDFLSCPETGCPDTDRDRWRRKLRTLRDYGYNYVRCQSYVYGPEYYDVADEVGLLVQSEMGMLGGWGGHTQWHVYAWPPPTPAYRRLLREQWNLVVARDVHHPSANLYCMSNELGSSTHFPRIAWQCYHDTKALKPTAFIIWTDGGHNDSLPEDFVNAEASVEAECEKPLIQHEYRWWSSLPDVRLMSRYDGAVRPYGAETAWAAAVRHGLAHLLPRAAETSQHLQFAEAKAKMEACRRDYPRLAGICHFNAMDTNPSPQGIINEFYEPKVVDAATWRQTNGDTVILSSLGFADRVLVPGNELGLDFWVSDFSHPPLREPCLRWELRASGQVLAQGELPYRHEPFLTCAAGRLSLAVSTVSQPTRASLSVSLTEGERIYRNEWALWLLPSDAGPLGATRYGEPQHTWLASLTEVSKAVSESLPLDVVVLTECLDDALMSHLHRGGRVLLAASEGLLRPFDGKLGLTDGRYYFTPPANYPPYEDGHDGTIIADHRALGDFPHEGWADLQFFRLMAQAPPLDLEPLGLTAAEPIIRVLHSYPVGRSLGYLYEGAVGEGRLLISALDLNQSWPEARYLLRQFCNYLLSAEGANVAPLSAEALAALVEGTLLP